MSSKRQCEGVRRWKRRSGSFARASGPKQTRGPACEICVSQEVESQRTAGPALEVHNGDNARGAAQLRGAVAQAPETHGKAAVALGEGVSALVDCRTMVMCLVER